MATEKQKEKKLDDAIKTGDKKVKGIVNKSRRSINGAIKEATEDKGFLTSAAKRNKLFAELAAEYKVLNSNVNDWVTSEVDVTAKNWFNFAKEDLPKSASIPTFGAFSEKYVDDIIGFINPATADKQVAINAQIGGMLTNDVRELRAAVSTTMAEGAVEGLTLPQMSDRMQKKVAKSAGQFKFLDKAGRAWTADNYFSMLNTTLHSNAARQTYIDVATKEAGYDLFIVTGGVTGSSIDNPNDPCDRWAGRIFSMTGATEGFPTYAEIVAEGVYHPRCVHDLRAVLPSEVDEALAVQKEDRKDYAEIKQEEV